MQGERTMEKNASAIRGLSSQEAAQRLFEHGKNELEQGGKSSALKIFAGQFKDIMILVLLASTVISVLMGEGVQALTIVIIILINAVLGFSQEYRTEKTLQALKNMTAPTAQALRDGKRQSIPAGEIVPGDLIYLKAGDRVPADAALLEAVSLQCDEALLSGESVPVEKVAGSSVQAGEQPSGVYMGTTITKGHGQAVVTATGMNTQMGKIAGMIQEIEEEATPLQRRLGELGKYIAVICIAICAVVSVTGILRGEAAFDMMMVGISLAVAAVPEGLPAIVTIALALAVNRILKRNALVRRLYSVETLGCANVICTDKTGTLTENRMTCKVLFTLDHSVQVSGSGYGQAGELLQNGRPVSPNASASVRRLLEISALCSNAEIMPSGDIAAESGRGAGRMDGTWQTSGDPTEIALLVMAAKGNVTARTVPYRRDAEIPFDSDRKRMTVLLSDAGSRRLAFTKGAPDLLLANCKYALTGQGVQLLTPATRAHIEQVNGRMASQALRVLGFAYKEGTGIAGAEQDMTFVGLAGMIDPPRKEVYNAVKQCRQAKIRTVMVTGDHKETALAIAGEIGILRPGEQVMTGAELEKITDRELERSAHRIAVYARVTPAHKLRIVKALKASGNIVAMTGDGVNDAPAIKEADIGVSMGISGTDVTKNAASVILLDDNFATLVAAVEEGRIVYSNIRKFIRYLLSCNIGEVVTMFAGMLMGLPVVLLPIQILFVNLATDGLPALALSLEAGEPDSMRRKPRPAGESVFSGGLATTIFFRGCLIGLTTLLVFTTLLRESTLQTARTGALTALVITQLFHVFECKSEHRCLFQMNLFDNIPLVLAAVVSFAMMLLVIYFPPLQRIFATVALTRAQVSKVFGFSLVAPVLSSIVMMLPKKKKNDLQAGVQKGI